MNDKALNGKLSFVFKSSTFMANLGPEMYNGIPENNSIMHEVVCLILCTHQWLTV